MSDWRPDWNYDMECWLIPFKRGDRIREKRTGEMGVVHDTDPYAHEDNLEVRLDDGTFTMRDFHRWELVSRLSLAAAPGVPDGSPETE